MQANTTTEAGGLSHYKYHLRVWSFNGCCHYSAGSVPPLSSLLFLLPDTMSSMRSKRMAVWRKRERDKTELYSGIERCSTIIASYMHVLISQRTSMAVLNVCTFTERGSQTSSSLMSAITPLSPSTPHVVLPSAACFAWDEKLGTSKIVLITSM